MSNDLARNMVNFPSRIIDCDCHSPPLLDLFLSSDASSCSTMDFLLMGNSDHVVVSTSMYFPSNSKEDARISLNLMLLLLLVNFVSGFRFCDSSS